MPSRGATVVRTVIGMRLRAGLLTAALVVALFGLAAGAGYVLGGKLGAALAVGLALFTSFAASRYADIYVLRSYRATPLSPWEAPELFELVRTLAARAD